MAQNLRSDPSALLRHLKLSALFWRTRVTKTFHIHRTYPDMHYYFMAQGPSSKTDRSSAFMEPTGSSAHSQQPATCPYREPDCSSQHPLQHFSKIHVNIIPHLRLGLPSGLLPSGFPTKTLYAPLLSPIRATRPAHLILLDLITRIIHGEEYRAQIPRSVVFSTPSSYTYTY
jgi:hypothetical protein